MILNTKKLKELAEHVVRKCEEFDDEENTAMGKDWAWAELTEIAIPNLEKYLVEGEK